MPVNINTLLALPRSERKKIAEKLFQSLSPNNSSVKISKQEEAVLEKRWESYISGKMKFFSSNEMQKKVFGKK
jgi:putative addiction module component (TIGR02574 family)